MKFKFDENLSRTAAAVLSEAGFDVVTVSDQELEGALDRDVIERCAREERCLVTLDAEFGKPLLFPPDRYRGIVLLRIPGRATAELDSRRPQNAARCSHRAGQAPGKRHSPAWPGPSSVGGSTWTSATVSGGRI